MEGGIIGQPGIDSVGERRAECLSGAEGQCAPGVGLQGDDVLGRSGRHLMMQGRGKGAAGV